LAGGRGDGGEEGAKKWLTGREGNQMIMGRWWLGSGREEQQGRGRGCQST